MAAEQWRPVSPYSSACPHCGRLYGFQASWPGFGAVTEDRVRELFREELDLVKAEAEEHGP